MNHAFNYSNAQLAEQARAKQYSQDQFARQASQQSLHGANTGLCLPSVVAVESEFTQEVRQCDIAASALDTAISHLYDRLGPVLRPCPPADPAQTAQEAPSCEVTTAVRAAANAMDNGAERIRVLLVRLAI